MSDLSQSSAIRGVTLPKFSGKEEDFPMFSTQMMAYATMNNWDEALTEGGESNLPSRHDAEGCATYVVVSRCRCQSH